MTDTANAVAFPLEALPGPREEAARAAKNAGIWIEVAETPRQLAEVDDLFRTIWRRDDGQPPLSSELLRALTHAGNYVALARDEEGLIGACAGFFADPRHGVLHSHIAGVAPRGRDRNVGLALKLHQRAWAADRGIRAITWTFDPLVSRNAYFNITKLGAVPQEYLTDFYGAMIDGINAGQGSDRLLVSWPTIATHSAAETSLLESSVALSVGRDGEPIPHEVAGSRALVAIPRDIELLRVSDPALARAWRGAVREVLGSLVHDGAHISSFDRRGWYVVDRPD